MIKFALITLAVFSQIALAQAAPKKKVQLMSAAAFKKMTVEKQDQYIGVVQNLVVKMEEEQARKGIVPGDETRGAFINFLLPTADAARLCAVGGVFRQAQGNKCPTRGRSCGTGDNFLCGNVFGNVCVPRSPVESLSIRCYGAAQKDENKALARQKYEQSKGDIEKLFNENCGPQKPPTSLGCVSIQYQLDNFAGANPLPGSTTEPFAGEPAKVAADVIAPAAPAPEAENTDAAECLKAATMQNTERCIKPPTSVVFKSAPFNEHARMYMSDYVNEFEIVTGDLNRTYFIKDGKMCLKYEKGEKSGETCAQPFKMVDDIRVDVISDKEGKTVGLIKVDKNRLSIVAPPEKQTLKVEFRGGRRIVTTHPASSAPANGQLNMPLVCQSTTGTRSLGLGQAEDPSEIEGFNMQVGKGCSGGLTKEPYKAARPAAKAEAAAKPSTK